MAFPRRVPIIPAAGCALAPPARPAIRSGLPEATSMKTTTRIIMLSLLALAATASPARAQSKSELTVALSSFSAETLDPALQGHNVKYYLSLMFDYLVGVTPEIGRASCRERV